MNKENSKKPNKTLVKNKNLQRAIEESLKENPQKSNKTLAVNKNFERAIEESLKENPQNKNLHRAIEESLKENSQKPNETLVKNKNFQRAIEESLKENPQNKNFQRAIEESLKENPQNKNFQKDIKQSLKKNPQNKNLQIAIKQSLINNPPLNPPPSFNVKIMPGDGYCGYHSIIKYCQAYNIKLFHNEIPFENYPVELLIEEIRESLKNELLKPNIGNKGNDFISTFNMNNKLTVKDNIYSLITRTYAERTNIASWLDYDFIKVISYFTNKCFLIFNNIAQSWTLISTKGIECNKETIICLMFNGRNHFDSLQPKLNTENQRKNFNNFINQYKSINISDIQNKIFYSKK